MRPVRFGNIEIDPAVNPAVLDTLTWDVEGARRACSPAQAGYWLAAHRAAVAASDFPVHDCCTLYPGSYARHGAGIYLLARLSDGQYVFLGFEQASNTGVLGSPIHAMALDGKLQVTVYAADAGAIRQYVRAMRPDKGPRAMGAVPRLGIGTRMSTAVWPGIWPAMEKGGFRANAIQNSVRELNLLEDVLAGRPPRSNYLYGFGTLEEGHTGSTFEGLWAAGVIEALKTDTHPEYGADADHITVRRGSGGIERAKRTIDAARDYTFFTLDVSDILDYATQVPTCSTPAPGGDRVAKPSRSLWHRHPADDPRPGREPPTHNPALGAPRPCHGRLGYIDHKYGLALEVVAELFAYIKDLKGDTPFDLELSIDECPSQMDAAACLTTEAELLFLIEELRRRGVALTHVAPNVGIVKGQDYVGADGLVGFEGRIRGLQDIAREQGIMLDFHSGDDLRSEVRRAIGRATRGWNHFKVSPSLQILFAEVLHETYPERFQFWWDDTLAYARREAIGGSEFAAQCLRQYQSSPAAGPSPHHAVFHHYGFASVGRRDGNGQFVNRHRFYDLPADFYALYRDRTERFLCEVAADVFCG
jgi:hypothetical protein